ncbi:uncharacterized protein LOC142341108 [Convolutriloba macropyga]|uniref:uncharacterized protein LOC142341108 n=1 Tax=Convolutriloba macropyga TaxID=536237 RepID=UPI003F520E89
MNFELFLREYETITTFTYREGSLYVENTTFTGENKGFFDMYEEYVFVRGEEGHLTCIPRKKTNILFKKDGKDFHVSFDQSAKIYRTQYGLWFSNPTEADNGNYTCYLEEDPDQMYHQKITVIGPPEINCNYDEVVIRLPNSSLEMECEVSSDFLSLHSPTLYWDDEPINANNSQSTLKHEIAHDQENSFKIKLNWSNLKEETDTGVIRIMATAHTLNRSEVLTTLGFKMPQDDTKVYFADYRQLSVSSSTIQYHHLLSFFHTFLVVYMYVLILMASSAFY